MKLIFITQLFMIVVGLVVGTMCVNYDLGILMHRTIPTFWAFVLNFVTSGLAVPLAIVLKILSILGVIKAV